MSMLEPDPDARPPMSDVPAVAPGPAAERPTTAGRIVRRENRGLWTSLALLALVAIVAIAYVVREHNAASRTMAQEAALDRANIRQQQSTASTMAAQANAAAVQATQSAAQAAAAAQSAASNAAEAAAGHGSGTAASPTDANPLNQTAAVSPPAGPPPGAPGADQPSQ